MTLNPFHVYDSDHHPFILEASVTVTSVLGMLTSLPCNITPSLPDDRYTLHMYTVHMYDIYCSHKGDVSQEDLFSLVWIAQGLDELDWFYIIFRKRLIFSTEESIFISINAKTV